MADVQGQIEQARKAGYSDAEIADFLKQKDPKVAKALDSGYQPQEVLSYLTRSVTPSPPPPGMRRVGPGDIPTASGFIPVPEQEVPRSFMQRVTGTLAAPLDVALTLGSGAAASGENIEVTYLGISSDENGAAVLASDLAATYGASLD
ncbi:MAG: hypothetical protein EBT13_13615 [Rhodobacteraceae bacterium]|nr:hypothetical protein [Paracoccaceae bacterium]